MNIVNGAGRVHRLLAFARVFCLTCKGPASEADGSPGRRMEVHLWRIRKGTAPPRHHLCQLYHGFESKRLDMIGWFGMAPIVKLSNCWYKDFSCGLICPGGYALSPLSQSHGAPPTQELHQVSSHGWVLERCSCCCHLTTVPSISLSFLPTW